MHVIDLLAHIGEPRCFSFEPPKILRAVKAVALSDNNLLIIIIIIIIILDCRVRRPLF